jgi:hypothetical protein
VEDLLGRIHPADPSQGEIWPFNGIHGKLARAHNEMSDPFDRSQENTYSLLD